MAARRAGRGALVVAAACAGALTLAAPARAQADPSEIAPPPAPLDPAPIEPVAPPGDGATLAPVLEPLAGADGEPHRRVDPLVACRTLLLDDDLIGAERCAQDVMEDASADDAALRRRATALLDVARAWRQGRDVRRVGAAAAASDAAQTQAREVIRVDELITSGTAEAVVHGAAAGGGAGFLVAATLVSITRASEADTFPWLVAAPAVGGVGGAVGAYALARAVRLDPGDLRLATSGMWLGATEGLLLQMAVFNQSTDVGAVPLQFLSVLGGGVLGLGAGAALGPFVDVTDGDVAVAHSAALWGGVVTAIGVAGVAGSGVQLSFPAMVMIVAAGVAVPYAGTLAAHPVLEIDRWPSFLIDAGGAAGLFVAGAGFTLLAASGTSLSSGAVAGGFGAAALAGVATGAFAAHATSAALRTEAIHLGPAAREGEE